MKVALVAEWLDPWRGGAETSTQQFIHQLMDRGVDIHLFTRSRPSPAPGLHVHPINGAAMTRTRRSLTFTHRVERRLASGGFDVVHAISPCRLADVYQPRGGTIAETIERNIAVRASRPARRIKRITSRMNMRQQYLLRLERKLLGGPDGPVVVAISDYVVRQLKKHYALPDARIRKVLNGVDPDTSTAEQRERDRDEVRREYGIPAGALLILSVAHNFRLKGVHCWMQALALLRLREVHDVKSLVIGRGELPAWHRLARRLELGGALSFVGQTDRPDRFYHAADVVMHPTYYDPCSRVVLEAMARGIPCVTTQWDGASEIIVPGQNGFVVGDPADTDGLAHSVELLRDRVRREEMGRAARQAASAATTARHTAEMLALYTQLFDRHAQSCHSAPS